MTGKKMKISKVGHLSRMTTEVSTGHLLGGEEAIPKGGDDDRRGSSNAMESLNFERVTNSYSIATRRSQLVRLGLLPRLVTGDDEEEGEGDGDNSGHSDHSGYFNSIRLSLDGIGFHQLQQQLAKNRRQKQQQKLNIHFPTGKQWTRWIITISVGLLCGLVAIFILFFVQKIGEFRQRRINYNLGMAGHAGSYWQYGFAFLEYTFINL